MVQSMLEPVKVKTREVFSAYRDIRLKRLSLMLFNGVVESIPSVARLIGFAGLGPP